MSGEKERGLEQVSKPGAKGGLRTGPGGSTAGPKPGRIAHRHNWLHNGILRNDST